MKRVCMRATIMHRLTHHAGIAHRYACTPEIRRKSCRRCYSDCDGGGGGSIFQAFIISDIQRQYAPTREIYREHERKRERERKRTGVGRIDGIREE